MMRHDVLVCRAMSESRNNACFWIRPRCLPTQDFEFAEATCANVQSMYVDRGLLMQIWPLEIELQQGTCNCSGTLVTSTPWHFWP